MARRVEARGCDPLWAYARSQAKERKLKQDVECVRDGLAAIALEAGRIDFRDSLVTLYLLYRASVELGADPAMLFAEGCALMTESSWPGFSSDYANFLSNNPDERFAGVENWA